MTAKEYIKTEWGEAWLRHEWQPEDVESAMIEYGKQQWNEAIDAAAENAEVKKIESPHGEWLDEYVIDEESILKLKKK